MFDRDQRVLELLQLALELFPFGTQRKQVLCHEFVFLASRFHFSLKPRDGHLVFMHNGLLCFDGGSETLAFGNGRVALADGVIEFQVPVVGQPVDTSLARNTAKQPAEHGADSKRAEQVGPGFRGQKFHRHEYRRNARHAK